MCQVSQPSKRKFKIVGVDEVQTVSLSNLPNNVGFRFGSSASGKAHVKLKMRSSSVLHSTYANYVPVLCPDGNVIMYSHHEMVTPINDVTIECANA